MLGNVLDFVIVRAMNVKTVTGHRNALLSLLVGIEKSANLAFLHDFFMRIVLVDREQG